MTMPTTERPQGGLRAGNAFLPLEKMEIDGAIIGLLHRTRVSQTYRNDQAVPLEAIYIHPLPPKAAVHSFRLVVGARVIEGVVQERGQARQAYQQAVEAGHRAALMEEERSDIFTTTVGNIAPGEAVTVSFELSGPLEFLESTASLRFPLVVPEIYIPGRPLAGGSVGDGVSLDTGSVPDASRLTPPRLPHGAPNPVDLRLSYTVDPAGLDLQSVTSLSHFARATKRPDGIFEIGLLPGFERLDHDVTIRLQLSEETLQTTLVSDPETGSFALTVVPPLSARARATARDIVIVLDRSGSMEGWSMTAARRAAARMVESLTPLDRFAVIAFDNAQELLDPHLVPADARHQQRALEFLTGIEARGGTEAKPALERALRLLDGESASDKTILFVTDGDVGNDAELVVAAASGVRVSTVGIGANSRAGVLESIARTSGGLCSLIPDESTLEESLRNLHQRLGRPHWIGLSVNGLEVADQAPRFWDVWEGVPVTFFGRASNMPETVEVEGWLAASGRLSQPVSVQRRGDTVVHRSWARARLLDLDDLWTVGKALERDLVDLSVKAQVLCRFTAFAAIDESEVVAGTEARRQIVQPVEATLIGGLGAMAASPILAKKSMARRQRVLQQAPEGALMCPAPAPLRCEAPAPPVPPKEASPRRGAMPKAGFGVAMRETLVEKSAELLKPFLGKPKPAKKRKDPDVWDTLRELLERLETTTDTDARKEILDEMVTILGTHHRAGGSASETERAQRTMILLLELKDLVERDGDEGEARRQLLDALGEHRKA